jgi:hypothetical protein
MIHRLARTLLVIFPSIALITVLLGLVNHSATPPRDEGTGARIFQLSILAFAATFFLYLVTADWREPRRVTAFVAIPVALATLAFCALYYLEHVIYHL